MRRFVVVLLVSALTYGCFVHIYQLATGGWPPYAWAPAWLAAYYTALTVLDPLAAVLLAARRTAGVHLAAAVLVSDTIANVYASVYVRSIEQPAGLVVIGLLAIVAVVSVPMLRSWTARR
ncbi:hypothetical protein [Dactylosporangium sp. CS-033363]|uniref:hypothetical protein n=1 Tax=Dactylosporangium sp. CS-033363 TaxID=3239935 RepID=UPI003D8B7CBF